MSEEELKKTINIVAGIEVHSETEATAKEELISYVEQLHQQNKCVKINQDLLYEEIYQKTQDCGRTQFVKLLQQNQIKINQLEKENNTLKQAVDNTYETSQDIMYEMQQENEHYKNILTEFEKWLEEEIEKRKDANVLDPIQVGDYYIKIVLKTSLDKLQELKEGKNEKNNK